jgi:DNA-binding NarL/FixJ family response regulator
MSAAQERLQACEVRILIADDHDVVRAGLQNILEMHGNWRIVAVASNGKEVIQRAAESNPNIAVIGHPLALISGIDVTRQIKARLPRTEVLILTTNHNEILITEYLRAGALAYLLKSDTKLHLIAAIEALASHKPFFTPQVSEVLMHAFAARTRNDGVALTRRQRQVLQLIAEGHTNKAAAEILNISIKTVETHRAMVMRKLNFSSAAALVRYAVRNELIEL